MGGKLNDGGDRLT